MKNLQRTAIFGIRPGVVLPLAAVLLIPVVCIFLSGLGGGNIQKSLAAFFLGPWSNRWFLGNTLDGMALLLLA